MAQASDAGNAVVAADGTATVRMSQPRNFQTEDVSTVTVSVDAGDEAEARIYVGEPSPGTLVEGTYSGVRDTSVWPAGGLVINAGEQLVIVWTGALPGSLCTATVRYR